ncbi:NnrU family protein [Phaeovulum sp. W22_SRMD_FR3]|uniref:NnrU family protein n=1 Tax=Phaeovulum sp. W22_SRMD_FR3 TaxID=3240274 RepID=UPI003F9526BF
MHDWVEFGGAAVAFLALHAVPSLSGLKAALRRILGRRGYGAVFGLGSLALFYWLLMAAGRAPFVEIWAPQPWMRWLVNLAMPFVSVLAVSGIYAPNPFAFEGRSTGFDPARPGIVAITRQPLLVALAIWGAMHLLVNADVAHVAQFGGIVTFSLLGIGPMEARRRAVAPAVWDAQVAGTRILPFAAGRWPRGWPLWRIGAGLMLWVVLWHLHPIVIGVSPAP